MPDRPDHRRICSAALVLATLLVAAVPATATAKTKRPQVTGFSVAPASFAVGAKRSSGGFQATASIRYTLSKKATVKIAFARRLAGRRSGGHCVKPTARLAKRKACTRYKSSGALVRSNQGAGAHAIGFSGRVGGKRLHTGTYRARITAVDGAHRHSRSKSVIFTIGRRQQGASGTPQPAPGPSGPAGPQRRNIRPCSVTLPSIAAVSSAVASAAPGPVVCLAPGSYGRLMLNAHPASEVVVQPNGRATIAGADLKGGHLTLEGFDVTGDEVTVEPGSDHMTVQFNRISGGHFGIDAGPTTTTTVDDATIRGNQFVGNFGEDAMRLNRYHDGDGDGVGILIEGNEITGVVEDGQHNDCLQTVWVGDHLVFRRNWLHANNCQGFFVKDQASAVDGVDFEDNLIVDHNLPCEPTSLCPTWVLSPVQIFGPITTLRMANNTVWTPFRSGSVYLRDGTFGNVQFVNNVTYSLQFPSGDNRTISSYSASNNVTCQNAGWPATGLTTACSLPFPNPATDDYRLGNGRGVDWAPAEQQYGP
jgi:hypothetical protein